MILEIQPRDPLIVRDGRPFSAFPGAKVRGYPFPPPQVIAGAVRGRVGLACGYAKDAPQKWRALLSQIRIEGPLLLDRSQSALLYPAPLDALLMKSEHRETPYTLFPLRPEALSEGALTNLPEGLMPVFAPQDMPAGKPETMPAFWHASRFFDWLSGIPDAGERLSTPGKLGISGPQVTYRTHVKIEAKTHTAEESMLFETSGLEFTHAEEGPTASLAGVHDLALLVRVSGDPPQDCGEGLKTALTGVYPIGGERRLALWEAGENGTLWPAEPPPGLTRAIAGAQRARVVLLTPADFNTDGNDAPFLPEGGHVDGAKVVAAAVGRPLTVSGWDMLAGAPKPSRRLAPAGSVYFVDLSGVKDIEVWVTSRWMQVLAEQPEQSQRDGYGLAVVGVWR